MQWLGSASVPQRHQSEIAWTEKGTRYGPQRALGPFRARTSVPFWGQVTWEFGVGCSQNGAAVLKRSIMFWEVRQGVQACREKFPTSIVGR